MSLGSELTSGKCTIYAQWCAILSVLFLIIFGITNFLSVIIFAIIAFVEAFFMIWLELPLLAACLPGGPKIQKFKEFFAKTSLRAALYAVFAVLIWLSLLESATSILVAAVFLTLTSGFYLISVFKKEELERSGLTGGAGIAAAATRV
ncbi:hypothetical protein DFS34DRAFT_597509 [Phlyctochytrium arcticum]|nr:hypothetical protein DFS34DRAFT_597509 [Phlyctochytrium arcticum]